MAVLQRLPATITAAALSRNQARDCVAHQSQANMEITNRAREKSSK
jgi:hypothetical protein